MTLKALRMVLLPTAKFMVEKFKSTPLYASSMGDLIDGFNICFGKFDADSFSDPSAEFKEDTCDALAPIASGSEEIFTFALSYQRSCSPRVVRD